MNVRLWTRLRLPLIIAATLILVFGLLSLGLKRSPVVKNLEGALVSATAPVLRAASAVGSAVKGVWNGYLFLVGVARENAELKKKLQEYQQKEVQYQEALHLAKRLESLLELRRQVALPVTGARVVAYDPSWWSRSVIVDQGRDANLAVGWPVLSGEGIVGRIVEVYPRFAKVMLIVDRNSGADAMVQRTRVRGILQGRGGNRCSLEYVPKNADVEVGDQVLSSGLGGVYPPGLVFGRVTKVDKKTAGPFQAIEVIPGADLSALEEVLIVKTAKLPFTP